MKEIKETNISPELEIFMKLHKIPDIIALLTISNEDLLQMNGFGWRLMKQVLGLRKVH
jgi:hypothetical protein